MLSANKYIHGVNEWKFKIYIFRVCWIIFLAFQKEKWWVFFSMNQIFFKKMTNVFKKYVVENIYQITDNYVLNYLITYFIYLSGWILYVLNCFYFLKNFRPCTMPLLSCIKLKLKQNELHIPVLTRFCHCCHLPFFSTFGHSSCIHLSITAIS